MSKIEVRSVSVGTIAAILVECGSQVSSGEELLVIEVMKMQLPVEAPRNGRVESVAVSAGDLVKEGDLLMIIAGEA